MTRFDAVATAMEKADTQASLERSLRSFGMVLARIVAVLVVALIVALCLAIGAWRMAQEGALVKRVDAIEDLGGMTVLCCDKTETLSTGHVLLAAAVDISGGVSQRVRELALISAGLQTGCPNAIDAAIRREAAASADLPKRIQEVPYDVTRGVVSVLIEAVVPTVVTKGAVASVLSGCTRMRTPEGSEAMLRGEEVALVADGLMGRGSRVLAVGSREMPGAVSATPADEQELSLGGNEVVAVVDPLQKARVVTALRKAGSTVGFPGDGINDAVALKSADVGFSASGAPERSRGSPGTSCAA